MARTTSIAELVRSSNETIPRRPILTHLNADTSWLISFPKPPPSKGEANGTSPKHNAHRAYFHLLVDPWLTGTNTLFTSWLISFTHKIQSVFNSIEDVKALVREIEQAAAEQASDKKEPLSDSIENDDGEVDAVMSSHFNGDHCNQETITQIPAHVPIICTATNKKMIESWKHFDSTKILCMPDLDIDAIEQLWQKDGTSWSTATDPDSLIPSWLRIGQIPSLGPYPGLHWAQIIAWSPEHQSLDQHSSDSDTAPSTETILYTPHGIYADRLQNLEWTHPTASRNSNNRMLAIMHGLNAAFSTGTPANLGLDNGWELVKKTAPRYWIPTHDEELSFTGIIGYMQRMVPGKFEDLFKAGAKVERKPEEGKGVVMRELENGESFVLA